jgi:hypothetical protein
MGKTLKALKTEIYNMLKSTLSSLKEEEKKLTKEEKETLRQFLEQFNNAKVHSFSNIFIAKKIKEIIANRKDKNAITELIIDD